MNPHQEKWWKQARSDLRVFRLLRRSGVEPCHQLHYLQMATEKLTKAYLWRGGGPPQRSHAGFVNFLRKLGLVEDQRREALASALDFRNFSQLRGWIQGVIPLAHELERLAPALAQNGPNPEYPWPHDAPVEYPADYEFTLWTRLLGTASGRRFLTVVEVAIDKFPMYA
ncbi:hypothetical protein [Paludisphaera sp.]|uniref:hypothetical protein n=1 Tax=Paludisphaera sp. TaxID=2017432 RepID=UPI00301D7E5C